MANSPRFCPNCGAAVEDGARFCEGCGVRLSSLRPASQEPKTTPTRNQPAAPPSEVAPKKRGSAALWITCGVLAGLGALVMIACLAVLIFLPSNIRVPLIPQLIGKVQSSPTALQVMPTPFEQIETPAPVVEDTAVLPEAATPEPEPTAPGPTPNASYQGIQFKLDPSIASGINGQTLPANPPSQETAPWDVAPQTTTVDLKGYVLSGTFHTPRVYIYPVKEFSNISDEAKGTIENLSKLLADKKPVTGAIPFLPMFNAAQMMRARVAYLDFQNGSGIRFLTQYGQDVSPVNNNAMFYCFQGLTSDGKYYISAILPIQNPLLPATSNLSQQDYEALTKDYQTYLTGVIAILEGQSPASFTPDIDQLDALVQSFLVK